MQKSRTHILSTRPLDPSIIDEAKTAGIDIDVLSFIDTEAVTDASIVARIAALAHEPVTAIFTSMNAVDAVTDVTGNQPAWKVGSIGTTTRTLIEQKLPHSTIIATGNNASELAENLASVQPGMPMVFFCGDQRRDELPSILHQHNMAVEEVVVYKTFALPQQLKSEFDGIAFYSPSAVDSYFSINSPAATTIMFAIGETTANTIKQHCTNKIVVSASAGKNNLVKTIIDFYTTTTETVNRSL